MYTRKHTYCTCFCRAHIYVVFDAIVFPGEILRMTHVTRGLDSDGALLLDIVVNGHISQLPSHSEINIKVQIVL